MSDQNGMDVRTCIRSIVTKVMKFKSENYTNRRKMFLFSQLTPFILLVPNW